MCPHSQSTRRWSIHSITAKTKVNFRYLNEDITKYLSVYIFIYEIFRDFISKVQEVIHKAILSENVYINMDRVLSGFDLWIFWYSACVQHRSARANRNYILFADVAQFIRDDANKIRNTHISAHDTAHTTTQQQKVNSKFVSLYACGVVILVISRKMQLTDNIRLGQK
jgi:hypothetical protein